MLDADLDVRARSIKPAIRRARRKRGRPKGTTGAYGPRYLQIDTQLLSLAEGLQSQWLCRHPDRPVLSQQAAIAKVVDLCLHRLDQATAIRFLGRWDKAWGKPTVKALAGLKSSDYLGASKHAIVTRLRGRTWRGIPLFGKRKQGPKQKPKPPGPRFPFYIEALRPARIIHEDGRIEEVRRSAGQRGAWRYAPPSQFWEFFHREWPDLGLLPED
jgi:hypothetical protein